MTRQDPSKAYNLASRMLPLLVDTSINGPPLPSVPSSECFWMFRTSTSKSVEIDELEVRARTRALACSGIRTRIDELEVVARTSRTASMLSSIRPLELSSRTG